MRHTNTKTVKLRIAANDNPGGTVAYDASLVSIARMLARHNAQTAQAANDNRRPKGK